MRLHGGTPLILVCRVFRSDRILTFVPWGTVLSLDFEVRFQKAQRFALKKHIFSVSSTDWSKSIMKGIRHQCVRIYLSALNCRYRMDSEWFKCISGHRVRMVRLLTLNQRGDSDRLISSIMWKVYWLRVGSPVSKHCCLVLGSSLHGFYVWSWNCRGAHAC